MHTIEKTKLNIRLAQASGFKNIAVVDGHVYASNPEVKTELNIISVVTVVDFTNDWNIAMPLAIKTETFDCSSIFESETPLLDLCIEMYEKIGEESNENEQV